jgi:hypothetical protein
MVFAGPMCNKAFVQVLSFFSHEFHRLPTPASLLSPHRMTVMRAGEAV